MDNVSAALDDDASFPHGHVGYRLSMVRHAWVRRVEAAIVGTGLTHLQFVMLRTLQFVGFRGHAPSQSRLAGELHIDRMTASTVLRTLEAKGLVAREVNPADPRANDVTLTAAGAGAIEVASKLAQVEQQRFFGRLGPARQAAFSAMLAELLDGEC